eukprot:GHVT01039484.1.p1 GENE.GHVT01039484.1~~GHVT01039484.1.p1  ORF type:complete len:299 (-),score=42.10 GHVT01039484.1:2404-3240(-)
MSDLNPLWRKAGGLWGVGEAVEVNWPLCAKCGVWAAGLGTLWWLTRRGDNAPSKDLTKTEFLDVLRQAAKYTHIVLIDLAQMAQNVHRSMKAKQIDGVPQEQLEAMILKQGFQTRLDMAQENTLTTCGVTEESVRVAKQKFSKDAEVVRRLGATRRMYEDALGGRLPLLPDVDLPPLLTAPRVLEIHAEILAEKERRFESVFESLDAADHCINIPGVGPLPTPALGRRLEETANAAESTVLDKHSDVVPYHAVFNHAVAFYSRESDFKAKVQSKAIIA